MSQRRRAPSGGGRKEVVQEESEENESNDSEEETQSSQSRRGRGNRGGSTQGARGGRTRGGAATRKIASDSEEEQEKPKRKRRKKGSDDEDEEDPSEKKKSKKPTLSKEEELKLVGDVMRYAIFSDRNKLPVRRDEIRKNILKDYAHMTDKIIKLVKQKFKDIFGYDFQELPVKSDIKNQEKASGTFALINSLDKGEFLFWKDEEKAEMTLLMLILSVIYLNNKAILQDELYGQLKRVGLEEGAKHSVFGDWHELIEKKFTRELYLERVKKKMHDGFTFEFRVGPRAKQEIDMKSIVEFICNVYGEDERDNVLLKQLQQEEESSDESSSEEESDKSPPPSQGRSSQSSQGRSSQSSQGRAPQSRNLQSSQERAPPSSQGRSSQSSQGRAPPRRK